MSGQHSSIMEAASQALSRMAYLECEALCLEALTAARNEQDWANYGRILMPLQECRRQRRMIAADGHVRLGTSQLDGDPIQWLTGHEPACIAVTSPDLRSAAQALSHAARENRRYLEVLWMDNDSSAKTWTVRPFDGPGAVSITVDAPPADWREQWLSNDPLSSARQGGNAADRSAQTAAQTVPASQIAISSEINTTPADWFLNTSERLGDAILEQVRAPLGTVERVAELEQALAVVTDHEILHQRLGDAARAMLHKVHGMIHHG